MRRVKNIMNKTQSATDEMPSGKTENSAELRSSRLKGLVSIQMVNLFSILRRTGASALKRDHDLSEVQHRVLTQVGQRAPVSLNGLAELLMQDRGQLSRAVKGMVERGILSRKRKPGGPEIEIDLTPVGEALYATMVERAIARDRYLTEGIDKDDLAAHERVIAEMIKRAEVIMEEERARIASE